MLSIGIIGTGGMGGRHAANIHKHIRGARVAAVYDFDAARAKQVAADVGGATAHLDAHALIEDRGVDAVIIASPDPTHVDYTLACIQQHKQVLCEKPLALTATEALRVVEAERSSGRTFVAIGFMRRFDPQHLAVRDVIATGRLGRAILYKGVHRNATVPASTVAGKVITGSGSHDIDAARWLLNREVTCVYTQALRAHPTDSPTMRDLLLVQLGMGEDCAASIEVFVSVGYGYEVSAEIVAEHGSAITLQPDHALVRTQQNRGVHVPIDWLARFQDAYISEIQHWVDVAQSGAPFTGASAWDGYQSVRVTDACLESLRTGQCVML